MAKTTPWIKIKAEYLQGITPKELAKKYKIKAKTITEKASKEKWVSEKAIICKNLQEKIEDKIKRLAELSLDTLEDIVKTAFKDSDRVSAAKAILDVSGLKTSKQEITGKDGTPLTVQKVFITQKEEKMVKNHIKEVINDAYKQ